MPDNTRLQMKTKVRKRGGSYYLLVPKQLAEDIGLRHNHNAKIQLEEGKHRRYISSWIPALQEE